MSTDYMGDLKRLEEALNAARARVRHEISVVAEKQRSRKGKKRPVSDHAVVRYLERTGRLDPEPVRDEIRSLVAESANFAHVDGLWHSKTGMVFILEAGTVVTVLSQEQSEKYIGSELAVGGVADHLDETSKPRPKSTTPVICQFCGEEQHGDKMLGKHILEMHSDMLGAVDGAVK